MNAVAPDRFDAFRAAYDAGRGALVWRHGIADLLTPVAAFLKAAHGQPFSFLLESVEGGAARGRYSVIGMAPDLIWRCEHGQAFINRSALTDPGAFAPAGAPPLQSLRALIEETRLDVPDTLPPMTGGLSGYLGYDMVRLMEKLPATNPDVLGIPEAILVRPGLFIIFDGVTDEMTLAAPVYPRGAFPPNRLMPSAQARLNEVAPRSNGRCPNSPARWKARWNRPPTWKSKSSLPWWRRRKTTFAPGTCSRWCRASVSRRRSRCRLSRCIAACATSTRRRSCSIWISTASSRSAPARKSWCGCATAR